MSLTKRDIELMQLGFKCFENAPKVASSAAHFEFFNVIQVNYEKLASLAGLKNASSAQTCYNGAKRKFTNGAAAATHPVTLATGTSTTQNSSPSAPTSKKRKTSAKTTTSKPTKGKGGKASSAAAKGSATAYHDDDASDAENDAEDDEEPGEGIGTKDLLALISEETAANAAALQWKIDQEAHIDKQGVATTLDNGTRHAAAKPNAGADDVKAEEAGLTTGIKAEAQDDEEAKANELMREALQMAMNTSRRNAVLVADQDASMMSSKTMMDLSKADDEDVGETSMAAAAKTISGLEGGKQSGTVDEV